MKNMSRSTKIQLLLWVALVLSLVGSLRHVAWGFSTLEEGNLFWGYIQAIAVDLGLLAIAIGIQQARLERRTAAIRWLWCGAAFFALISVYANLLHGLVYESAITLQRNWKSFGEFMIVARPFLLSGVLPLMVIYLSEVVAANGNYAVAIAEMKHEEKREQDDRLLAFGVQSEVYRQKYRLMQPPDLVAALREKGIETDEGKASEWITEWNDGYKPASGRGRSNGNGNGVGE
jgi:hypothetical protein